MRIGITYDLRDEYLALGFPAEETAEFDRVETIDAIDHALTTLGHVTDRVGSIASLVRRLADGDRWDLVFNIAEGLRGYGREAQVPALLDAYDIPYVFSDPLAMSATLHKAVAKRIARDAGVPTPDFAVVEEESDIERLDLPFPLFVKPVAEGTGKGISPASVIRDAPSLRKVCLEILGRYRQAALVERYLPGREFTIGVVGSGRDTAVIGTIEVIIRDERDDVYSYRRKEECETLVRYEKIEGPVARRCAEVALSAWRALGCRDGGRIDVKMDENGVPNFLEVNPLPGLHPTHSDLPILASLHGISYRELIGAILDSAVRRITGIADHERIQTAG